MIRGCGINRLKPSVLAFSFFIILVVLFDLASNVNVPIVNYAFVLMVPFTLSSMVNIKWSSTHTLAVLFIMWCVCTMFWNEGRANEALTRLQTCALMVVLFIIGSSLYSRNEEVSDFFIKAFFLGTLILSIMAFLGIGGNSIETLQTSERLETGLMDDNFTGKLLSIGGAICVYYFLKTKSSKRYLYGAILLFFAYNIILFKSKSSLLAFIVGITTISYTYSSVNQNKKKFYASVAVISIILYFIISSGFFGDAFIRLQNMFSFFSSDGDMYDDLSTFERVGLIEVGFNYFKEKILLGYGIGSSTTLLHGTYFHNNYVQLLVETGLVGFLLYYSMVLSLFVKIWKCRKNLKVALMISFMVIYFISDFNNTSYYSKTYFILLSICYVVYKEVTGLSNKADLLSQS